MKEKLTEFDQLLTTYRHSHQIPGFTTNIVAGEDIVYSQGFGMLDAKRSVVTGDTIFSIQNITKSFTASALVHLEEETDFSLDTPIIEFLPYFRTKHGDYENINSGIY